MPQVTHSVVDVVDGDPVGVRAVEVRIAAAAPVARVYRASDGAEVRPREVVTFTADPTTELYPSTWSLDLPANSDYIPSGTHYELVQSFDNDNVMYEPIRVVVPDGAGPYRLVDLLAASPPGKDPIVVGWTPAGDWDPDRTYYLREVVAHNGASYVARGTTTGIEPGSDGEVWQLVAAGGSGGEGGFTPDATTTIKGKTVLMGGTAANPTVPWTRVTGAPASLPPSGGAGGVLSGTYPNPGFAVDMATQAELNAHIAAASPHPQYDDLPSLSLLFQNGLV